MSGSKILLILLLSSCSLLENQRPTISQKIHNCVFELVGQHGVNVESATKSCKEIYEIN